MDYGGVSYSHTVPVLLYCTPDSSRLSSKRYYELPVVIIILMLVKLKPVVIYNINVHLPTIPDSL